MAGSFVDTIYSQTMNIEVTKTVCGIKDLTGLCTDLFLIVIRMHEAEDLGEPSALRKLIVHYIDLFQKNCKALAIPEESILEAKYAIVALIDETVLCIPGECRDFWISRPLQLDIFGDNLAGQEFFNKLQKLLLQVENKKDVLQVYYLCLSLGFEGRYRMGDVKDYQNIIEDLGSRLRMTRSGVPSEISPHGKSGASSAVRADNWFHHVPLWIVAVIFGVCGILTWTILFLFNNADVSGVVRAMLNLVTRS